jgi:glycosyltransferase involved in cell wall biosynthesis
MPQPKNTELDLPESPLVSIITSVLNAGTTLEALLLSVARIKDPRVEFVVVDGESTDATPEVLRKYQSLIDVLISEKDGGIYEAWNKGVRHSTGQFVAFVGADDVLLPNYLAEYSRYVDGHPEANYISSRVFFHGETGGRSMGEALDLERIGMRMMVAHVGSWHRRDLFDRHGLYDENLRIVADYEFLLRARGSLLSGFFPIVTVEMSGFGVSNNQAKRAIGETRVVKDRYGLNTPLKNRFDASVAVAKFRVRRAVAWWLRLFPGTTMADKL